MNNIYVQEYNARIERAFRDMDLEGIEDYDSYAYIDEQGGFTVREVVGHYLYTYVTPDRALDKWVGNTDHTTPFDLEVTHILLSLNMERR